VISVVSPTDAGSQHLGVLARLASLLRSEDTVRALLAANDPGEVVALLDREDDRFEKELAERRAGMARPRLPRPAAVDGPERALRG
jgi:hypothetical protein